MKKQLPLKIIFAGTPKFSKEHLEFLLETEHNICAVMTQPDRPAGRGQQLVESPVKKLALKHELTIFQPETLQESDVVFQQIAKLKPDVIITVAYGLIFPEKLLSLPRLGCFNIHASFLPRWRGSSPIQFAILAGDTTTGVTIIKMVKPVDAGPILIQQECSIDRNDTAGTLLQRLTKISKETLKDGLVKLQDEPIALFPQDKSQVFYTKKIKKEDAKINWSDSAIDIDRQIRAFNPRPIAYTDLGDERIKVFNAIVIDQKIDKKSAGLTRKDEMRDENERKTGVYLNVNEDFERVFNKADRFSRKSRPGTIIEIDATGIKVATADKIICLTEIQFPGGSVMPVSKVIHGRREFFIRNRQFT